MLRCLVLSKFAMQNLKKSNIETSTFDYSAPMKATENPTEP